MPEHHLQCDASLPRTCAALSHVLRQCTSTHHRAQSARRMVGWSRATGPRMGGTASHTKRERSAGTSPRHSRRARCRPVARPSDDRMFRGADPRVTRGFRRGWRGASQNQSPTCEAAGRAGRRSSGVCSCPRRGTCGAGSARAVGRICARKLRQEARRCARADASTTRAASAEGASRSSPGMPTAPFGCVRGAETVGHPREVDHNSPIGGWPRLGRPE